jgi:serine/threonine/tyrosine-interacting protein
MDLTPTTSGQHLAYVRTQKYDDKQGLEPDRILIPPPILDFTSGTSTLDVSENVKSFNHLNGTCGNPEFLQSIRKYHALKMPHVLLEWKYGNRNTAQPILPFLFLGPGSIAQNQNFVQSTGITMMVAVRSNVTATKLPKYLNPAMMRSGKDLESMTVDLDSAFDLIRRVRGVVKAINDHLEQSCTKSPITSLEDIRGKVLIFCESGNERSTTLVCAYLMIVFGVDAVTSIQIIQSQRFSIDVKDDMKNMLFDFESILVAERQVAEQEQSRLRDMGPNMTMQSTTRKSSKRTLDEAEDEEMGDVEQTYEPADWGRRVGSAPFADAAG